MRGIGQVAKHPAARASARDPRFRIGNSSAKTVQTGMWSRSDRAGTAKKADEHENGEGEMERYDMPLHLVSAPILLAPAGPKFGAW